MDNDSFRHWSRMIADWGADYREGVREAPVRAQTAPGAVAGRIAPNAPEQAEPMGAIFDDFRSIIMPGMTHWQHPRFFAYFPANAAPPSVLAEYLVSVVAAQCMLWQTSPAATELETAMLGWMRDAVGLPDAFSGVIQDSASSATLAAMLVMRERALGWQGNAAGLAGQAPVRIYASDQVHSSIDRAAWVSGIGAANLVRIAHDGPMRGMDAAALDRAICDDRDKGFLPAGIVACVGATSTGSTDDVAAICAVAERHGLYVHVDAAWAGSAMICPEFRHLWAGVERADSIVINPHKWLGAQFDCSTHFVRDPEALVRTLAIQPDYLRTHGKDGVVNFSEWSVPLGRRFRALKLWFLLRAYGLEQLRGMIRRHVDWCREMHDMIAGRDGFQITSDPVLSLFSFRHLPTGVDDADRHNLRLAERINDDGRIYVTTTRVDGKAAIRFQVGQFDTRREDVMTAFGVITQLAATNRDD